MSTSRDLRQKRSENDGIPAIVEQAVEAYGRLDVAFNNAGTATGRPIESVVEPEFDRVIDMNVKTAYFCLKAQADQMKRQGGGAIVFNASVLGGIGLPGTSVYNASKGAIIAMMRAAAVELGPTGIRVNCINPELTRTPLTTGLI